MQCYSGSYGRTREASVPESVKYFLPFRMMLKVYTSVVLLWDLICLIVYSQITVLQAVYHVFKPPPMKSVVGEIALIVGAGRGVGKEIAKAMASLGAKVICIDINDANNEQTAKEAQKLTPHPDGKVWVYTCDVTKKEEVVKMSNIVKKEVGDVTMLFHCCGIPSPRSLLSTPPEDIYPTIDLTLSSHFWLLEMFLPSMKRKNHGHIVALSSVAGLSGQKGQLPLSVSQFAVQGLAESLLEELRISKNFKVHITLVHIYPFIVSSNLESDIRLRIPSYFGTINSKEAATMILEAVRRDYIEVSIPRPLLFIGHILRILPRKATIMMRELLDTGIDFV